MDGKLDAEDILERMPFSYYVINLKDWKIVKSNDPKVIAGRDVCYKAILNKEAPCDSLEGCICKNLIRKGTKAESHIQPLCDMNNTEYLRGEASIIGEDLAFVTYRNISQDVRYFYELDINNKRLKRAEELAGFGYWELNLDTKEIVASEGAMKIYGVESEKASYSLVRSAALPEFREVIDQRINELTENGGEYNLQYKIRRFNDDAIRHIYSVAEFHKEKRTVFGVVHDNTNETEAQEALVNSEFKLKQLFKNMNTAFAYHRIITDEDGNPVDYLIENVNPKFEEITGIKAKDVVGKRILEVAPESEDVWIKKFGEVATTGSSITLSEYSRVTDKFLEAIVYSAEKGYCAVTFNDVTDRVKSEKALKESLLDLELAQRISQTGNWKLDPLTKTVQWSDQMYSLFDREKDLGPLKVENYRGILNAEDFRKFLNVYSSACRKGVSFEVEFEHTFSETNKKWLRCICVPEEIDGSDYFFLRGTVQDITERKNSEVEIRKSNELLRLVIDSVQDAIYLKDIACRKVLCNKEDAKRAGFDKPEDLIGKSDYDLFSKDVADKYAEDDRRVILDGQIIQNKEEVLPGKDGDRIILTSKFPLRNEDSSISGLVGIGRDVTQIKANSSLVNLLYQTVEQIPLAVVIADEEGIIEYVNRGFTEMAGYSREEVVMKKVGILKNGSLEDSYYEELWGTIRSGKTWYGEFLNLRKNGEEFWVSAVIAPILNSEGEIKHFVAIEEDITGKKQMLEDLERAKRKAEESDRLKSLFLANMSHEIRTPLNGILGFSNIICAGDANKDEMEAYGKIIKDSGRRLLAVIDDIIDISKIQSNQLKLYNESFNINDLITELHLFYSPLSIDLLKKLDFKHQLCGRAENALVYADKDRIYQVFRKLIDNALKFTCSGYIEFGFDSVSEEEVILFVKDTGIGIDPEKRNVIFQSFRQVNEGKARKYDGSGLGLAIVSGVLKKMNGKIWVESVFGEGSVFYFSIPRNVNGR